MSKTANALSLLRRGLSPAEIKGLGFSAPTVSRALRQFRALSSGEQVVATDDLGLKPQSEGVSAKSIPAPMSMTPGALTIASLNAEATAIILQPKVMRLPVPDFLPIAMAIARKEWGWTGSVADFIDTIIYHFFAGKGYHLGTYYRAEGAHRFVGSSGHSFDAGGDVWVLHQDHLQSKPAAPLPDSFPSGKSA